MPSYPVKWFSSDMGGAPVLSNTSTASSVGFDAIATVVKNCLINGFNVRTDATATITNGVATLTFPSNPAYLQHSIINITGASEALLNGDQRVLATPTATTLTIAVPGAANGTVTGTITTRVAAAGGWTAVNEGSSAIAVRSNIVNGSVKLAYRINPEHNQPRFAFRLLDSSGSIQYAERWDAFSNTINTARPWFFIVDAQTIYFWYNGASSSESGGLTMLGEFRPVLATDIYTGALISGPMFQADVTLGDGLPRIGDVAGSRGACFRFADGTGGPGVQLIHQMESFWGGVQGYSGAVANTATPTYPNGNGNGLILSRKSLSDSRGLRGWCRGMYMSPQNCHTSFAQRQVFDGQGYFAGRKMMALKCGAANATTSQGVVFFDIDGPWESWS
jgi:hypothetical protein